MHPAAVSKRRCGVSSRHPDTCDRWHDIACGRGLVIYCRACTIPCMKLLLCLDTRITTLFPARVRIKFGKCTYVSCQTSTYGETQWVFLFVHSFLSTCRQSHSCKEASGKFWDRVNWWKQPATPECVLLLAEMRNKTERCVAISWRRQIF